MNAPVCYCSDKGGSGDLLVDCDTMQASYREDTACPGGSLNTTVYKLNDKSNKQLWLLGDCSRVETVAGGV